MSERIRIVDKMNDYIDRQAAIKDVYAIHTVDTEYDAALIDRLDVRYVLESLPSADVVPVRRGRWIARGFNECECSECRYVIYSRQTGGNYCPNCGARMDGDIDG